MLSINGIHTWGLNFTEIMEIIHDEPVPHELEWGKHEFRADIFRKWMSFAEMRRVPKFVLAAATNPIPFAIRLVLSSSCI